jgi:peptide/nickel transport system ATP-binding protein
VKVKTKQVSITYKNDDHQLLAVDRVDLALNPGTVTALVGESGSGKTTLGKAMLGLLPPSAAINGDVFLGETEITRLDEASLNKFRWSQAAMVFQNGAANLNPVHHLVDQVAEPLIQHLGWTISSARDKARSQMAAMGLKAELADRFPHELSGGQVQRVLLAMALIMDPEVLILDEPTASLDAMTKNFVHTIIRDLAEKDKSVLLITHDLDLARNAADEAAVLYLGRIMESLPARELFQPRHPYTLALSRSYPGMDTVRDLGGIRGDAYYRLIHAHCRNDEKRSSHSHVVSPGQVHEDGHAPAKGCLFRPRCTQAVEACRRGDPPLVENGKYGVRCLRGGIVELLRLEETHKSYMSVRALRPVSFSLWTGEVFCLVGETGSGKSTLAMIAAAALEPDGGKRVFDGRDMAEWARRDYRSLASRIGVIHQNPAEAVSHRLNVFEIAAEPLIIQKRGMAKPEIRERVLQALADVRLSTRPEFLKRYPHELNMGAIQRLCLARALVQAPDLLVADEPTSALDPSVQAKVLKMLLSLQIEKGLTLLFVTHDLGLARKIADRIGVMLDGRIIEIGPAATVLNHPGHPYTQMLIESARGAFGYGNDCASSNVRGDSECPFMTQCLRSKSKCRSAQPEATDLDSGRHLAWCHNPIRTEPLPMKESVIKTGINIVGNSDRRTPQGGHYVCHYTGDDRKNH